MSEQLGAAAAQVPFEQTQADDQQQAELFASLADVRAPEQGDSARGAVYDTLVNSTLGRKIAVGGAVLGLTGVFGSEVAVAADAPVTVTSTTLTVETGHASLSAQSVAQKQVTIGEDVHAKGKINMSKCHWTKGGFTNSMRLANGKVVYYHDSVPGKLCADKSSPTGEVKVAGGKTGRKCNNPATDNRQAPGPMVKGEVLNVASLNMNVKLHAVAEVTAKEVCGTATGKGEVLQRLNLKAYLRRRTAGKNHIGLVLKDKAIAKASANIDCKNTTSTTVTNTTPPPPPPPPGAKLNHPPTITINNAPQHAFVNGQLEDCVTTFDPDGDALLTQVTAQRGTVSATRKDPANPNIVCVTYTAPGTAGPETITWTTQDNKDAAGNPDNVVDATAATPAFPIVSDQF